MSRESRARFAHRIAAALAVSSIGCEQARNDSSDSDQSVGAPKLLRAFVEHENTVAACDHRQISLANYPSLIPNR